MFLYFCIHSEPEDLTKLTSLNHINITTDTITNTPILAPVTNTPVMKRKKRFFSVDPSLVIGDCQTSLAEALHRRRALRIGVTTLGGGAINGI